MADAPLSDQQLRFCQEYLFDLNATKAAIRAGYAASSARQTAARLMSQDNISTEVDRLRQERSERTKIDAAWLLSRLAEEAQADVNDLYDEEGGLKPVKEWPKIWRQGLVAGLDVEMLYEDNGDGKTPIGRVAKIKLSDRIKRLELIGRHVAVQAFQENVKVTGLDALADRLSRAKAK